MKILTFETFVLLVINVLSVYCNQISFQEHCIDGSTPLSFPSKGKKSSGSIVMSKEPQNGTWYQSNMNCSVTFSAEDDFLLLLTFSNISLRNSSMDNLTVIYDSGKSLKLLAGQQVCSNENCEGLKFDSGEFNNITLIFLSSNYTVPSNITGFKAHYTVYDLVNEGKPCKDRRKFLCDNRHCIWDELVCDGHNNCEDRSDETKCIIPLPDTVWGIVVIVIAILCIIVFVPLFCCLATYGTRSIVKSVTLSNQATPLLPATECGEASGLLTSSDVINNCWPGTSYDRSNSFSYGTSHQPEPSISTEPKRYRSMSEACEPQGAKFL